MGCNPRVRINPKVTESKLQKLQTVKVEVVFLTEKTGQRQRFLSNNQPPSTNETHSIILTCYLLLKSISILNNNKIFRECLKTWMSSSD